MTAGRDDGRQLARRLGLGEAVVIGLGSMIGAGVFAAIGPAARAAGPSLLVALGIAALVAYANATSSAQLAAAYPEAGGTYVYGRKRLGPLWGYLAGWGFIVGKTASLAAMGLTFGAYADPGSERSFGIAAVLVMTVVNYRGIIATARVTKVTVVIVLTALAIVVAAALLGGTATPANLRPFATGGVDGILEAAGLLFFVFAGYARIATLGEEVIDPAHTIPKAIPLALGLTLVVYAIVFLAALVAVGPNVLARAEAPLAAAVTAGDYASLVPAVRIGGAVAALGALLSLLAGVSRTTFAMARNGELPRFLDAVHPVHRTPHRAELAVGAIVVVVAALADLRGAIGFSSFAVLMYYAITNAAAWTQPPEQRRWPRSIQALGMLGCALLALSLPAGSVVSGVIVLGLGVGVWLVRRLTAG